MSQDKPESACSACGQWDHVVKDCPVIHKNQHLIDDFIAKTKALKDALDQITDALDALEQIK